MKLKSFLASAFFFLFFQSLSAQEKLLQCSTDEMDRQMLKEHPEFVKTRAELEKFILQWTKDHPEGKVNGSAHKIIPVVFHVLHNYGAENISDAQIHDGIRVWNEDFQKLNPDTTDIVASFKAIAASMDVEFRLATIDPSGNCTNGIERIPTLLTYNADNGSKLNTWPSNKYLNVWTCASQANGSAAYAQFPGGSSSTDGIMSLHSYIGSIGTSSYTKSRTLTHEAGHCFTLFHCWGNGSVGAGCSGDDGVADTPPTTGFNNACILNQSVCNPPVIENAQNFMEYSYCTRMFTQGQVTRMEICLNSTVSGRNNLWSSSNLIATGTADPYTVPVCAPRADFVSSIQILCVGGTTKFTDLSWGGQVTNWQWTFPGGTPDTSSASSPTIQYNTIGTYSVSLNASNGSGGNSFTKTSYIIVVDSTAGSIPVNEGFESPTFPPPGVVITNPDNSKTWQRATTAGSSGTASMVIVNSGYTAGQVDEYITPSYDFTNMAPSVTFDRAYALFTADTTRQDGLKIYYTTNCGQSWSLRYSKIGSSLTTAPKKTSYWIPTASEWKADSLSVFTLLKNKPNVRFKFQATSAAGNNLYIDNINITGIPVGIEDLDSPVSSFDVYPNPAKDQFNIHVTLEKTSDLRIELFDITGRKISDIANEKIAIGAHNFPINKPLQNGVYFVRLSTGNSTISKRVVVLD